MSGVPCALKQSKIILKQYSKSILKRQMKKT